MARIPVIPENVIVHLGTPDSNAENVTIPFRDYIKNVASSEIFSTWPDEAIRANVLAQISYALNRIYGEWYPAKGYDFDITNNTQFDQKFIYGRNIYENISLIVDNIFNDYIRKKGTVNPFFAQYCNGTTVTCKGLSQWGTVDLANSGLNSFEILENYYGDDIELVVNAPVAENTPSYPDTELSRGDLSESVRRMQVYLNRISRNYPAIPKIPDVTGSFGQTTEDAVKEFQKIFNLTQTGVINKATWYKIIFIFDSVTKLQELNAEGVQYDDLPKQFKDGLKSGSTGGQVITLQYFLSLIAQFSNLIPQVEVTGFFGPQTENSLKSFQRLKGLPETGIVDKPTWDKIYQAYEGITDYIQLNENTQVLVEPYPGIVLSRNSSGPSVRIIKSYLNFISKFLFDIPPLPENNLFGPKTQQAVSAFQRIFSLPITGEIDEKTWNEITDVYKALKIGQQRTKGQYPGYTIS